MELYLVQHGQAKSKQEDPARPLSDRGKEEVRKVARHAARIGLKVSEIHHSGKLRAEQTAQILAEEISPPLGIQKVKGLAPLDDPATIKEELEQAEGRLMLVGHLPHLSRLASLLLTGNSEKEVIHFQMGAIIALTRKEGGWGVKWVLTSDLVIE